MKMSNTIKTGCALGIIGGIVAMIGLVLYLEVDNSAVVTMSVYMLAAVLFFALAGAFSMNSQWSWKVLMFMNFVTLGIIIGGAIADYYNMWWAVVEAVIGILIVIVSVSGETKMWLTEPRCLKLTPFPVGRPGSLILLQFDWKLPCKW